MHSTYFIYPEGLQYEVILLKVVPYYGERQH